MENILLGVRANMWIQKDGAPALNANKVKDYLNDQFKSKWMVQLNGLCDLRI